MPNSFEFTDKLSQTATLFTFLAAITSTILFSTLVGALNTALKPYHVKLTLGSKMIALDWIAVVFSIAASMFWLVSICCCSGRSRHPKADRNSQQSGAGGAGYTGFGGRGYQPLGDHFAQPTQAPYGAPGQMGHEMHDFGTAGPYKGRETAYEPFRHERV
jgi:SUR7/PalI family